MIWGLTVDVQGSSGFACEASAVERPLLKLRTPNSNPLKLSLKPKPPETVVAAWPLLPLHLQGIAVECEDGTLGHAALLLGGSGSFGGWR